jgi:dTDP-4-dehydrorhamnose 3,5-epimerase
MLLPPESSAKPPSPRTPLPAASESSFDIGLPRVVARSGGNGQKAAAPTVPTIEVPKCQRGIGHSIASPSAPDLVSGVQIEAIPIWPDDRGHFLEVLRVGCGLAAAFDPGTTQVSATLTYPGVIKAFHYHRLQFDCWTVVKGMLQVALVDLRPDSPTFGRKNTMYVGETRPWQVLIPPGVAHGYKVVGSEAAVLTYVTSRFYDPADEGRIPFDDPRVNYAWEIQFK